MTYFTIGFLLFCLVLGGCDEIAPPRYRCVNNTVYVMYVGAWIEAKTYAGNKCLPINTKADMR